MRIRSLEALRGFAAVYVFAGHVVLSRLSERAGWLEIFFRFGQEAVILFFLVSGFVVHLSTETHKDKRFASYLKRRALRIFPIFVLAVLVSLATSPPVDWSADGLDILGNVLMLQDFKYGKPGVWIPTVGGNAPLWSLSYEWWFYMLYFPMRAVPASRQVHLVGVLSLLGLATYWLSPNQISLFLFYFLIWWIGAEFAKAYLNGEQWSRSLSHGVLYLAAISVLIGCWVLSYMAEHRELRFGIHPVLEFRHYLACLAMTLVAALWQRRGFKMPGVLRAFAIFAPISYGLYVLHYPVAISSSYLDWLSNYGLRTLAYVILALLAAFVAEIPYQAAVRRAVSRFSNPK